MTSGNIQEKLAEHMSFLRIEEHMVKVYQLCKGKIICVASPFIGI